MKNIIKILGVCASLLATGCTDNVRAKAYGGTAYVDLPPNTQLVTATWKDAELWYLYTDRPQDQKPKTYTLREQSNYGILEGKVIFKEQ